MGLLALPEVHSESRTSTEDIDMSRAKRRGDNGPCGAECRPPGGSSGYIVGLICAGLSFSLKAVVGAPEFGSSFE